MEWKGQGVPVNFSSKNNLVLVLCTLLPGKTFAQWLKHTVVKAPHTQTHARTIGRLPSSSSHFPGDYRGKKEAEAEEEEKEKYIAKIIQLFLSNIASLGEREREERTRASVREIIGQMRHI